MFLKQAGRCSSCPSGFTAVNSGCYYYGTADVTQVAARAACQALGSGVDLVSIDDSTENSAVIAKVLVTNNLL